MTKQFDLEEFKRFVASKPADEEYDPFDPRCCALGQFGFDVIGGEVAERGIPTPVYVMAIDSTSETTFGALLDRLNKLAADSPTAAERGSLSPAPMVDGCEIWRPIAGFEGFYEVSSEGRVRSLRFTPPREIGTGSDQDGYLIVRLYREGKRTTSKLHRVVCVAFHGPSRPVHREVAHLDGTRTNARADNLKWVSKRENHAHKRIHGTHQAGERCPSSQLSAAEVRDIKARLAAGGRIAVVARETGASYDSVREIKRGRNWQSVQIGDDPARGGEA